MNTRDKSWFHLDSSLPTGSIVKCENPCKSPLPQSQQVTTIPNMSHDLQIKGRKKMQTRTVVEVESNMFQRELNLLWKKRRGHDLDDIIIFLIILNDTIRLQQQKRASSRIESVL